MASPRRAASYSGRLQITHIRVVFDLRSDSAPGNPERFPEYQFSAARGRDLTGWAGTAGPSAMQRAAGLLATALGPWPTTPARTRTGPVTGVLRSSANEWGRRNHTEDWGRHGAHSLPNATQMQRETGKPFHIKGLLRILIPPFPGSNPGAPAKQKAPKIRSSRQR
jgi:hypothetical protein